MSKENENLLSDEQLEAVSGGGNCSTVSSIEAGDCYWTALWTFYVTKSVSSFNSDTVVEGTQTNDDGETWQPGRHPVWELENSWLYSEEKSQIRKVSLK